MSLMQTYGYSYSASRRFLNRQKWALHWRPFLFFFFLSWQISTPGCRHHALWLLKNPTKAGAQARVVRRTAQFYRCQALCMDYSFIQRIIICSAASAAGYLIESSGPYHVNVLNFYFYFYFIHLTIYTIRYTRCCCVIN